MVTSGSVGDTLLPPSLVVRRWKLHWLRAAVSVAARLSSPVLAPSSTCRLCYYFR